MGVFREFVSSWQTRRVEKELLESYTQVLMARLGVDQGNARAEVQAAIQACKARSRREGTDAYPPNLGDVLLIAATHGETKSLRIIEKARREGATDEDIREWWNLPDLARRMVQYSEDVWRYSSFLAYKEDEGTSNEAAARRVRRMFPMYGDPEDRRHADGEDRPLPQELRGRIDRWRERFGADHILALSAGYSSINALVRAQICDGAI